MQVIQGAAVSSVVVDFPGAIVTYSVVVDSVVVDSSGAIVTYSVIVDSVVVDSSGAIVTSSVVVDFSVDGLGMSRMHLAEQSEQSVPNSQSPVTCP